MKLCLCRIFAKSINTPSQSSKSLDPNNILRACGYIGVNPNDFNITFDMFEYHRSVIHGIGHVYRTMIACALLGEKLHKSRDGFLAFCGAYIHDLARLNDDLDSSHGMRAATYCFPKYMNLWKKYELTNEESSIICSAVSQHSTCEWMRPLDRGYDVMAMLKDADALDRCRFGDTELDTNLLRFSQSRELIATARLYCHHTLNLNEEITFQAFIESCNKIKY